MRRIPELNKTSLYRPGMFDLYRFHAVFTTADPLPLPNAWPQLSAWWPWIRLTDNAVIEQVNADLRASELAHLPSGMFTASAAWLVLTVVAFNLIRATRNLRPHGCGEDDNPDDSAQGRHGSGSARSSCATASAAPAGELEMATAAGEAV